MSRPWVDIRPLLLVLGCVCVTLAGCSSGQRVRVESALAQALISDRESSELGARIHEDLKRQGVKFVSDRQVLGYVHGVSRRIIPRAERDRPGVEYRVFVIDDPRQINAFATPGGYLYLYTGLLATADNEAEVAGVLGHEAAHISKRHIERQMVNSYGISALLSMALGEDPGTVERIAAGIAASGLMAAHGRSEEIEADEHGARYSAAAGYDPRAMITFFHKLERIGGGSGGPAFLRTHPTSRDRIANLSDYIEDNSLEGGEVNSAGHRQIAGRIASR